ncbi:MAG: hypothetical protein ACI8P9_000186 [Parasphingorhabdus sp.]|jgi:hypothetical protein
MNAHKLIILVFLAGFLSVSHIAQAESWLELAWPETDFTNKLVELDEIQSGGPPKDGIPPVDQPKFVSVSQAESWIEANEPVIFLQIADQVRAYPLQIMTYHEIVNDQIGEIPISITFCPLCNASIVFDRRVDNKLLDFGTTGLLRKSDLVMYDRQTMSWWQQFSGRAIIGEMAGTMLKTIPAEVVSFESFAAAFPNGRVLSRDTGHNRPYGRNPYQGYDRIGQRPFLFNDPVDPRLPAMERVLNVSVDGKHKIYPFSRLEKNQVINDQVGSQPVLVVAIEQVRSALDQSNIATSRLIPSVTAFSRSLDNETLSFQWSGGNLIDEQTMSHWNRYGTATAGPLAGKKLQKLGGGSHFAFAWLAFNPESMIYSEE